MADEQRIQAYVGLIEQLLSCPQGKEGALLQANAELVDTGLLAVIGQYADWLESQGNGNADWLRQFTAKLTEAFEDGSLLNQASEDAVRFGAEIMLLILQTQADQTQVYEFFQANVARLDETLLWTLPNLFTKLIQGIEPELVAALFGEFGNLIRQFPLGSRRLNLELAIAAYQQALQVRTRETTPVEWSVLMNNLALAYTNRIRGDRAQNIEDAIAAYQQALQVMDCETMPVEWANLMNNLAIAYHSRIRGDRAQNIEDAIAAYQEALTVRTQTAMPVDWAITMNNLASAYSDRIQGDKSQNMEDAINVCQQTLQVITRETMPVEWSALMNNLALAYNDRIRGDRSQNIEDAINAYQQALQVRTRETMPVEWATLMNNLASAYLNRIRGDRAQNIEDAINAYQQSLQVTTREAMPVDWAASMMNLANAYSDRIRGDRAQNIEDAIDAYQQSLQVMTREAMPVEWATSMMNLAAAYSNRILGDRTQNIEDAIAAHQQSLQVMTREAMPIDWAKSMMGLANAYSDRIRGDHVQNIEDAIAAYQQSLQVMTREAMPIDWARSMNNLAIAYLHHFQGDLAQNIEDAIAAYQEVLQVRTREAMPIEWATSMNNLAIAYSARIRGDKAQNIEDAIAAYQEVLQVRTREAMPIEWAQLMSNLANAYSDRIRGERAQNIKYAIAAYKDSLEIFTPELLPDNCRKTARTLGHLYFNDNQWVDASLTYQMALQAAEILYQSANLLDSRAAELAETADLPRRTAYTLARMGDLQKAVEVLEQGRARGLSESLDRDRADLIHLQQNHPELYMQYREVALQLRNLESQQRDFSTSDQRYRLTPTELRDAATALEAKRTQTLTQIRQVEGYADFLALPGFKDVRAALHPDNPLVYLVTTPSGSMALIVTVEAIDPVWLDGFNETQLVELLNNTWLSTYRNWVNAIQRLKVTIEELKENPSEANQHAYKQAESDYKQAKADWYGAIDTTTRQLWDALMGPLVKKVKELGFDRIILIPTGYLSFFPLHATWTEDPGKPTSRRYALDDLYITYTPNAQSLTAARAISDQVPARSILAIDNPSQDLSHSEREVQAAISAFPQPTVLRHEKATVEQVRSQLPNATVAHFSCHGTANLNEPLTSGLFMSDGLLTLKDIFALNLADTTQGNYGLRLTILSACETGMIGIENADEAINLPTGLLQAGVAAVIASLWSVSDLSTMLLLSKFYELWRTENQEPSEVLRQAQIWLRDSTDGEIANSMGFFTPTPDNRSYAHPYYWAAFSYTGI